MRYRWLGFIIGDARFIEFIALGLVVGKFLVYCGVYCFNSLVRYIWVYNDVRILQ